MVALKKFNLEGEFLAEIEVSEALATAAVKSQVVKEYLVALRANRRQWSANTKGRSEVKHTTRKPFRQKGTGRARQGSLVAPQFRGGGIVFGPKPKFDQNIGINRKEKRAAIRSLIGEKIREEKVCVIDQFEMQAPKTKIVANFLNRCLSGKRVLFLGEGSYETVAAETSSQRVSIHSLKHENFSKSARNLPFVRFALARNVSGYDLLVADTLVFSEAALNEINEWLL